MQFLLCLTQACGLSFPDAPSWEVASLGKSSFHTLGVFTYVGITTVLVEWVFIKWVHSLISCFKLCYSTEACKFKEG